MTAFPVADAVSINGVVSVTGSVALNPTPVITANTATTGSAGLAVGNAPYAPLYVTGSVALNPTPVITANTATTGSAGLAVGNAPYQPLFVSVTSSLPVTFAGLPPLSVWNATNVGVTGSVQAWSQGTVGVSGTVGVNNFPSVQAVSGVVSIGNWPATIGVSSSFPLRVFDTGVAGVSGTVQVWTSGLQGVSGTVGINNFPSVLAVSGSQLTGSTFSGYPVVVGGVSGSIVKALQLDTSGAVYVTTTGSLPVAIVGTVPVSFTSQISVNNFPTTQNVSGGVNITNWPTIVGVSSSSPLSVWNATNVGVTGSVQAWSQGTVGVSGTVGVNNFPSVQAVSGVVSIGNWPAVHGVSGTVQTWTSGLQGISGTVGVNNFPAVQAVSGSQLTGSTFSGFPVVVGGISGSIVKALQLDTSGALYITSTGSIAISTTGSAGLHVSFGGLSQPVSMSNSGPIGVFLTGAIAISTTGSSGLQISFGGLSQPVSMSNNGPTWITGSVGLNPIPVITANTATTGSTGLAVGNAPYQPLYVSITSSLPVTFPAGVNVTVSGSTGLMVAAPAIAPVWVTGSVALNPTPVITANTATTGSAGLAVGNAPYQPLYVSITSSLPVTFSGLPPLSVWNAGTVGVSGTVTANVTTTGSALFVGNASYTPLYVTVTSSLPVTFAGLPPLNVWNASLVGVSGTVGVNNFPAVQAVSGSQLTGSTFAGSPIVVGGVFYISGILNSGSYVKSLQTDISGALYVTTSGSLPVSTTGSTGLHVSFGGSSQPVTIQNSQISVNNFPTTQAVSGVVSIGNWPTTIGVSSSFPLQTWIASTVGVSGTVQVWTSAVQGVSGTVTANVTTTGSALFVGNASYSPLYVTVTSSLPVTFGGLPPLSVWNAGLVGVSGTVGVNNFPAVQAVSGSQLTGSTFAGSPVVVGGVFYISGILNSGSYVKSIQTDISGAVYITTSGSVPISTTGSAGLQISHGGISQPVNVTSQISVNNFPSVQAVSGVVSLGNWPTTIGVSSSFPLQTWIASTVGVSGTIQVWTSAVQGISGTVGVNNFPTVQAVSGSQLTGSTFAGSPVVVGGVFYISGILNSGSYVKSLQTDISGALYITTSGSIPISTTGSLGLAVANAPSQPLYVSVTSSLPVTFAGLPPLSVWNAGLVGVSGTVQTWTSAVQGVSGTVTANTTTTGSALFVGNAPYAPMYVSVTSSLPVTFAGLPPLSVWNAGPVGVSGTVQTWTSATQGVSGSQLTGSTFAGSPVVVGGVFYISGILNSGSYVKSIQTDISGAVYITTSGSIPVSTTGSAGLHVSFGGISQPVNVTSQISVNNFPATQNVSGGIVVQNWPTTIGVSSSFPLNVWTVGPIGVTGTIRAWDGGTQSVSGTVQVWTSATQGVSGSQLTGSTFAGSPVVVGGVFYISGILNSGSYVKSIQTDISGAVYITTSGSIPVSTTGSLGLAVGNAPSQPLYVSVTSSLPVTFAGLPPLSVWNAGPVGVSGTIQTWTSALQGVSGTVTANVTTTGSALFVGNASYAPMYVSVTSSLPVSFGGAAQPVSMSNSGPIGVFLTGSIPVTITGSAGLQVSFGGLSQPVSMSNNGPTWITGSVGLTTTIQTSTATTGSAGLAVGNAPYQPLYVSVTSSLPVTFAGLPPLSVWNAGPVGVSGTVQVWTSALQGVSGTVTANTTTTGTALFVGNAPYAPVYVSVTSSLPVTFAGLPPLSVWNAAPVGVSGTIQTWTSALQGVSGTVTANVTTTGSALFVSFGGQSQPITATGSIAVSTTGSAGLQVSHGGIGQPVFVTVTGSTGLQVSHGGIAQPVFVTVSGSTGLLIAKTDTYFFGTIITGSTSATSASTRCIVSASTIGLASVGVFVSSSALTQWISAADSISFEATINGVDWFLVPAIPSPTGSVVTSTTTNGVWTIDSAGFNAVRTRGQLASGQNWATNGTASVWFEGNNVGDGVVLVAPQMGLSFPITATGSIAVTTTGSAGLQISHGGISQPVSMSNTGPIGVFLTGSIPITTSGSAGLFVSFGGQSQPITATGSLAVTTTGSAGLFVSFGTIAQPVSMSNSGPTYVLTEVLVKGTQGTRGVSVQPLIDAGRTIKMFCTSSVSGVLGEALFNMSALSNYTLSGSVTSSWFATNGKTLRLQSATLTLFNATAVTSSVLIRMRVSNAAPGTGASVITAKSPSVWSVSAFAGTIAGAAGSITVPFPDGMEISGQQQFAFTQQASTTTTIFDFNVCGFEY